MIHTSGMPASRFDTQSVRPLKCRLCIAHQSSGRLWRLSWTVRPSCKDHTRGESTACSASHSRKASRRPRKVVPC